MTDCPQYETGGRAYAPFRPTAPLETYWESDMIQCPACRSADLQSNKFENIPFDHAAGGALAARQAGRPAHALSMLMVWAGVELANRIRSDWKCQQCGHVF